MLSELYKATSVEMYNKEFTPKQYSSLKEGEPWDGQRIISQSITIIVNSC